MADVTRAEFDALVARVSLLERRLGIPTTIPTPSDPTTPPTTPTVPADDDPVMQAPTVVINDGTYTLVAHVRAKTPTTFTYLQLAVRGAGAKDLALSPGTTLGKGRSKRLTGRGAGTGDFTAWIAYSLDGTTWVDGPKTTWRIAVPTDTPTGPSGPTGPAPDPEGATGASGPVGTRRIPLVGRSRMPFNSLVFRQSADDAVKFGDRRALAMDGLLYFTGRQKWDDFYWHPAGQKEMLEAGQIVVTSMPHAPESEGPAMNARGAEDAYKSQQRALGKWLADNGFNRPTHVIRVDWECNGNWYHWSANRPGGPDALREAIKNYVTNVRAGGATKVAFDLCFNKGPNQAGAAFEIFPGSEYIDVIGIDQYDMWQPSYNQSDWDREMAKPPSIRSVAEFATRNQIMWSMDEGGNTHGGKNQGGDNPIYWELLKDEIMSLRENCAWHVTYDDAGAPATLAHDFASNPRSWSTYQRLWKP